MNKTPLKKICIDRKITLRELSKMLVDKGLEKSPAMVKGYYSEDALNRRDDMDLQTRKAIAKYLDLSVSEIDFSRRGNTGYEMLGIKGRDIYIRKASKYKPNSLKALIYATGKNLSEFSDAQGIGSGKISNCLSIKSNSKFVPSEKCQIANTLGMKVSEIDFTKEGNQPIANANQTQFERKITVIPERVDTTFSKSNTRLANAVVELTNKNTILTQANADLTKTNARLEAGLHEAKHAYDELLNAINSQTLWQRITRKAVK